MAVPRAQIGIFLFCKDKSLRFKDKAYLMSSTDHFLVLGCPIPLREHSSQNHLSEGSKEEDSPVESKDVDELHPGVVFVLGVLDKLAGGSAKDIHSIGIF